jgi:predicted MFS family arabinose efflux permease
LALTAFVSSLSTFALGPFLPVLARDLDTSVALLGQAPALAALVAAALGLVVGPLADRVGYRRSLLLALASLVISAFGIALSSSFALLLLSTFAGVAGRAATGPVAQAVAGARFVGDARRRAMSWITGGVSAALVAGVPLLTIIDAAFGWRMAFVGLAALTVGSAALVGFVLRPDGARTTVGLPMRALLAAYAPIARHRPTLGLLGGSVLGLAGTGALITYLGAFLAERHGLSAQQVGWVYLALGVGALVGTGAIGGRFGSRPLRPLLVSARLVIGALGATVLLFPVPTLTAAGLLVLCVVLMAVCNVATPTLLANETPAGRATTMALNGSATGLGTALGAGLGGVLLAVGGYSALGLSALAWCAASAALVWWSRPGHVAAPAVTELPASQ